MGASEPKFRGKSVEEIGSKRFKPSASDGVVLGQYQGEAPGVQTALCRSVYIAVVKVGHSLHPLSRSIGENQKATNDHKSRRQQLVPGLHGDHRQDNYQAK